MRTYCMRGELWDEKNWQLFRQSQQDQMKAKMAESSRFKMYRHGKHLIVYHVITIFYTINVCWVHIHI